MKKCPNDCVAVEEALTPFDANYCPVCGQKLKPVSTEELFSDESDVEYYNGYVIKHCIDIQE